MAKKALSKALIEGATAAPGKRTWLHDAKAHGLALCVMPSGGRSFYFYRRVDGRPRQVKLGDWPAMTLEQARGRVAEMNAAEVRGEDLLAAAGRRPQEPTFAEIFEWRQEVLKGRCSAKTLGNDANMVKNHLGGLQALPLGTITKGQLRELHTRVGSAAGQVMANRVLSLVRATYGLAIRHERFGGSNPAEGLDRFREQSRDRRLSAEEVTRLLAALDDEVTLATGWLRDLVLLLLLTGARRGNVLAMRWDELDLAAATWRIGRTKGGRAQLVPLEAAELELLRERRALVPGEWVFPSDSATGHRVSPRKAWEALLERAGLQDLHLHDLRRSLASFMVDSGAALPVIGAALGHRSQAATAVYARLSMDPVREAKRKAHGAMMGR